MSRHHWTWKTTPSGFHVCCDDCGRADKLFSTEDAANTRVIALNNIEVDSRRKFSGSNRYTQYGLNRRIRKAKKVRTLLANAQKNMVVIKEELGVI